MVHSCHDSELGFYLDSSEYFTFCSIHFFQLNVNLSFFQENGTFSTCLRFCQMSSVSTDISVTKIAVKIKRVQIEAIDVYSDSLILTPNSISRYSPF